MRYLRGIVALFVSLLALVNSAAPGTPLFPEFAPHPLRRVAKLSNDGRKALLQAKLDHL
jgi:hypothetical protein